MVRDPRGADSWNDKAAHFLPTGMSEGWLRFEAGDDKRRLSPVHLPEALGGGWLCFESPAGKRRLHPIPAAWEHQSDADLLRFCADAAPAPRRTADPSAGGCDRTAEAPLLDA